MHINNFVNLIRFFTASAADSCLVGCGIREFDACELVVASSRAGHAASACTQASPPSFAPAVRFVSICTALPCLEQHRDLQYREIPLSHARIALWSISFWRTALLPKSIQSVLFEGQPEAPPSLHCECSELRGLYLLLGKY